MVKNLPANAESQVRSLVGEDSTGHRATKPKHSNLRKSTSSSEDPVQPKIINKCTVTFKNKRLLLKTLPAQRVWNTGLAQP